jgi:hypothetical protein
LQKKRGEGTCGVHFNFINGDEVTRNTMSPKDEPHVPEMRIYIYIFT